MKDYKNPWLEIPVAEYIGHMSDKHVRQYQMLNLVFRKAYTFKQPLSLLVLGATDGNGFEYIANNTTRKVIALDINQEYLSLARERFQPVLPGCEFICEDAAKYQFAESFFDMIHGALIFEYIDYKKLLPKISGSLKLNGVLTTVIQLEDSGVSKISETKYSSLKKLATIMKTVDLKEFKKLATAQNLKEIHTETLKPYGDKRFYFGIFERVE